MDELQALLGAAFDAEANLNDLMGQNKARYKERMREKLEKRRQRLKEGMSKDEVAKLEADEDEQFEDEMKQDANVNPLLKLMVSVGVFFILTSRESISDWRQFVIGHYLYSTIETIDS